MSPKVLRRKLQKKCHHKKYARCSVCCGRCRLYLRPTAGAPTHIEKICITGCPLVVLRWTGAPG